MASARARTVELDGLKSDLAARDQTIAQLEGRLAMREAAQRQLRGDLEHERSFSRPAEADVEAAQRAAPPRETVRIGRARDKSAAVAAPSLSPSISEQSSETRPMLRLNGDRRQPELTSSWTPPVASERLSVSPLPALPRTREPAPLSTNTVASTTPPPPKSVSSAQEDLYVHALDLLRRRELPEALRELTAFVSASAGDPRVARAHFWRGEILFSERQFASALSAFEAALVREPRGEKAADALLRVARCHQRLGAIAPARAALLELRTSFPDSAAARAAEREPEPAAQEDT